jgi:hypothetical protein
MAEPWANTTRACLLGTFFSFVWSGGPPRSAQCLVPAVGGLLAGLLTAHDRLVVVARVSKTRSPRQLPLQVGPLLVLAGGTVVFALLEQQAIGFLPHFPLQLRAILVGGFAAGVTSILGRKAFGATPGFSRGTSVKD